MLRSFTTLLILIVVLSTLRAAPQSAFTLKPGQAVYVVATRTSGQPDLQIEGRLQKAFEKHNVFKLARKASEADFVLLAESDYSGGIVQRLVCFVVLPAQYEQVKGNHDAVREAAVWTEQSKNGWNQTPEPLSGRLVNAFHEYAAQQSKLVAIKSAVSTSGTPEAKPAAPSTAPLTASATAVGLAHSARSGVVNTQSGQRNTCNRDAQSPPNASRKDP